MRRQRRRRAPGRRYPSRRKRSYEISRGLQIANLRAGEGIRWGSRLLSLILMVALGWLALYLLTADEFSVREVIVRGNETISAEEIYRLSGLRETNIFFVRPAQMEATIAQIPNIKEVRVSCRLPDQVIIEVEERQVEIVWQVGDTLYWIDAEGAVFPAGNEVDQALLIRDLDGYHLRPGEHIAPGLVEAVHKLRSLLPEVRALDYSRAEGLSFTDERGWRILLGMGEDLEYKVAVMKALSQEIERKGIKVELIDLRFKGSAYYR